MTGQNMTPALLEPLEIETEILRRRAAELAIPDRSVHPGTKVEVLQFQLAYEQYAIETRYVQEVIQLKEMTPLPQSPPFLLGVINVRGEPLSVLDLRKFFNLPGSPLSDLNRVIIVKDGTMIFGILVDRIREIRFFTEEKILQSKVNIAGLPGEYIAGVTPERVILLDAKSLLNDRAIIVNQTH